MDGGLPLLKNRQSERDVIRFSAPEVLAGSHPTLESDLYSVGTLFYRMYSGRDLFEDANPELLRHKYIHARPIPLNDFSDTPKALSDLIAGLVDKDPRRRTSAFEALVESLPARTCPAMRAPLTGRQAELKRAIQLLHPRVPGIRIVAIDGEIGVGKTRFLEELGFRYELYKGHFLVGRSYERDNRRFESVLQVITERFKRADRCLEEWVRTQSAGFAHSLVSLLPALKETLPTSTFGDHPLTTAKLVADLAGTLISLTKTDPSIVIVLEDMHWADEGTLQVLDQVSLRAGEANLCLVLTTRKPQLHGPTRRLMYGPQHPGIVFEHISLEPLGSVDALELARKLTGNPDRVPWIVRNGSGNPLFLAACRTSTQSKI